MDENQDKIPVSDEELDAFTMAVKTRFGLDFTCYEKKSLKRGLARLMSKNNFGSIMQLWGKILIDKGLMVSYIDELLVNLTEFFRNYELWQKLRDDILKKLNHFSQLTFWHAGCSTGEEVYTMAIVLKESFLLHKSLAWATDLSTKALQQAEEGRYNKWVFNKGQTAYNSFNPNGSLERYFTNEEGEYGDFLIQTQFKKHIKFERHNLVNDPVSKSFKVIFCRNVMIYFDDALKMKVLKQFYEHLDDDGYFIIGYYDMLPIESKEMFNLYCPITRIYTKNLNYKKK